VPVRRATQLAVGLLLTTVAACSVEAGPGVTGAPASSTVSADFAFDQLVAALVAAGAQVESLGTDPGFPFSVPEQRITASGHTIRVYEYADEARRADEQATIGMDGWSVGGAPVEWISSPHFWGQGRVIVQYLGDDVGALDLINRALGPEMDLASPGGPACRYQVGEYPPEAITVAVGGTTHEVAFLWWQCLGFNADSFLDPTPVTGQPGDRVEVHLAVEEGSTILVTAGTRLPTEPRDGVGWAFALPDVGTEVMIQICAADRRCAGYRIVVEAAP
jgi:hypothetical protein